MKIGEEFTDLGYTSISGTKKTADLFSNRDDFGAVWTMVVPKGSHAVAIGGDDVQELLVGRGATWRKIGVRSLMLVKEGSNAPAAAAA